MAAIACVGTRKSHNDRRLCRCSIFDEISSFIFLMKFGYTIIYVPDVRIPPTAWETVCIKG